MRRWHWRRDPHCAVDSHLERHVAPRVRVVAHCKRVHAPAVVRREGRVRVKEKAKRLALRCLALLHCEFKLHAVGRDVLRETINASTHHHICRDLNDDPLGRDSQRRWWWRSSSSGGSGFCRWAAQTVVDLHSFAPVHDHGVALELVPSRHSPLVSRSVTKTLARTSTTVLSERVAHERQQVPHGRGDSRARRLRRCGQRSSQSRSCACARALPRCAAT